MTYLHKNSVSLASPLHDPDARLLELLKVCGEDLLQQYGGNAVVSISPSTSPQIVSLLREQQFITVRQRENAAKNIGNNYLNALRFSFTLKTKYVHLIDFDRALHWISRFPRELRDVLNIFLTCQDFISFVRTKRAFETHPNIQRSTEAVINAIASEVAGVDIDIMSGSFGFDKHLAKKIISEVKQKDYGIYAEFLRVALKNKSLISTIEVEGLEWETPDQFKDEIRQKGYTGWLQEFESLAQWGKRIDLVEDSAGILTKTT